MVFFSELQYIVQKCLNKIVSWDRDCSYYAAAIWIKRAMPEVHEPESSYTLGYPYPNEPRSRNPQGVKTILSVNIPLQFMITPHKKS